MLEWNRVLDVEYYATTFLPLFLSCLIVLYPTILSSLSKVSVFAQPSVMPIMSGSSKIILDFKISTFFTTLRALMTNVFNLLLAAFVLSDDLTGCDWESMLLCFATLFG